MLTKTKKLSSECQADIFCGVNTMDRQGHSGDLEKKHIPVITAPERVKRGERFEVCVEVGMLVPHPNEPDHFIQFIELYAGDTYLARMDFTAKSTWPVMKVMVSLDHSHGNLRAFERCNLHGSWESDLDIEVV